MRLGDSTIDFPQAISDAALQNNVDPSLAIEVALTESNLNPNAVSPRGAIGIMQLMPGTAAQYGADPTNPLENIDAGTAYLGDLLNQFGGNKVAALAAYNWGPGNVQRAMAQYGPNWLSHAPAETQNYVAKILGNVATQYQATPKIPLPAPSATLPLPQANLPLPTAAAMFMPSAIPSSTGSSQTWIILAIVGGIVIVVYALSD